MRRCWARPPERTVSGQNPRIRRSSAFRPRCKEFEFCTIRRSMRCRHSATARICCGRSRTGCCRGSIDTRHAVRKKRLLACFLAGIGSTLSPAAGAADSPFGVEVLYTSPEAATVDAVTAGSLDDRFSPTKNGRPQGGGNAFWLKLESADPLEADGIPVVVMHAGPQTQARIYVARGGAAVPLPRATQLPGFRGMEDTVFTLVEGLEAGQPLYARIDGAGMDAEPLRFSRSTLDRTLARGAEHARMIALAFGALMAVALAALLIWFVLAERLFILYATLFFLQD